MFAGDVHCQDKQIHQNCTSQEKLQTSSGRNSWLKFGVGMAVWSRYLLYIFWKTRLLACLKKKKKKTGIDQYSLVLIVLIKVQFCNIVARAIIFASVGRKLMQLCILCYAILLVLGGCPFLELQFCISSAYLRINILYAYLLQKC